MTTIIIFISVLSILVFVHELGHFLMAKISGMKVEEFAIGFKPAIFQKQIGETKYIIGSIPFGGYVKILGENPDEKIKKEDQNRSFQSKPKYLQFLVVIMGIVFNLILAWISLSLALHLGIDISGNSEIPKKYLSNQSVKILALAKNSPAQNARIPEGWYIWKIKTNKDSIFNSTAKRYRDFIKKHDKNLEFVLKESLESKKIKRFKIKNLKKVNGRKIAGIYFTDSYKIKLPLYLSFYYGAKFGWYNIKNTTIGLKYFFQDLFQAKIDDKKVSGPIGIAKLSAKAYSFGFNYLLIFISLLSINLAILNLLPLPILDGGRALLILIESILRKKINQNFIFWLNLISFTLLIVFMLWISYKDILKLF